MVAPPGPGPTTPCAVRAQGLVKRYGTTTALDGLDLAVESGTVHGLLGPNGAGKTTVVRVLATLLRAEAGTAQVAGFDVHREPARVRARIGLTGQFAAVDQLLTGRENLALFGRLLHLGRRDARRRADELLAQFDLTDAADRPVREYSGGMGRRLDLAASLILDPDVLFLDEPTTGLDPRSRAAVWEAVRALAGAGTTVLLTTQYLEEADRLADRVSVIDRGLVIAEGPVDDLKQRTGAERLELVLSADDDPELAQRILERVGTTDPHYEPASRRLYVPVADGVAALVTAARDLHSAGVTPEDLGIRRPTLDDVFLQLTGHATTSAADEEVPA
ncbi:ATP-binding cassette domain-containing protein [Egibacter rhizosphaerae]|uniref:ATP-binding cassette domain-containing protein n=1 Tax=Egibacter rhizosphaerae TaxID=1670831 RepID=A0A411YFL1_9ACTN|nr:ATP-binding cassette domain-containing protein [Egibacter rhizosphaerae]QBI19897.1 ATP-binding cassette domain-containing protein [Egibacter rhizosphaerae]